MQRKGFTLVELLVVIAIIGILVALLLPAVNSAREAARRTQCRNNVKQIALALQTYLEANRSLPSAGWGYTWMPHPDRGAGLEQPGGWMYSILPFIEQKPLHQLGSGVGRDNETAAGLRAGNKTRSQTIVGTFNCPSRRQPALYVLTNSSAFYRTPKMTDTMLEAYRPDYAANGGDLRPSTSDPGPGSIVAAATYTFPSDTSLNGIIAIHKLYKVRDIKDGLSKTYLVGEKYLNPDSYSNGVDSGDNQNIFSGDDRDCIRWAMALPQQDTPGVTDSGYTFGSAHASGWNVAMCDGSVQTAGYEINLATHKSLAARNDGKISGN